MAPKSDYYPPCNTEYKGEIGKKTKKKQEESQIKVFIGRGA